jgi:periplasmic protein TonB
MKRLVLPAVLAIAVHAGLFWVRIPWGSPAVQVPQRRSVAIHLVKIYTPESPPAPAPEKVVPPPKPRPRHKPKPAVKPKAAAKPVPKAPAAVKPFESTMPTTVKIEPLAPLPEPPRELPAPVTNPPPDSDTDDDRMTAPASAADSENAEVHVSEPLYDLNPPIPYPRVARRRNYQGTVILEALVTKEGRVADVRLIQSSGYALLDRSALSHVKSWRFRPARKGLQAVDMWVQVPVRYHLTK